MKKLVVFYSRTGNTKFVAEEIAKKLKADIDKILDEKDRKRKIIGWIVAGRDGMKKSLTEIKYKKNPNDYDLVIIGTPIWGWSMTPAIRTYLTNNKFKNVAFFLTYGGNYKDTFKEMKELSKEPLATLDIIDKDIKDNKEQVFKKIKEFCEKLYN